LRGPLKTEEWEMTLLSKSMARAGLATVGALSLAGCATEEYVDQHIATVSERIAALESRVQQVDGTAQQANSTAQAAASAAQSANQRLDALTARVDAIEQQLASRRPRN
jgi:outer membrane murein-binding lipoprotein Lpp